MSLPVELILLVAKNLLNDLPALSVLARTSSQVYIATQPILYGQVKLSSQTAITSFCETILGGPRQFGSFVNILTIGTHNHPSKWLHLPKPLAVLIRATFSRLPNLRDLSMITTTSAYYIFSGLEFVFKLTKLQVTCVDCAPLYLLLSHQPSITELHLVSSNPRDNYCVGTAISGLPEILPHLNRITASLDVLVAIVPGRPLSEILVESDAAALVHVPESVLDSVFCGSIVSLRSVGYYHPAPHSEDWDSKDPWSILITTLEDRNIRQTLTRIRIFETSNHMVT
ncbi:hypothetical protein BDV93DRAFT_39655 [Ceratobasidium sp. AG-I]|nr:hypothetical protein BDV93DRAFT_39655 [Ceratobasidium sp. AG-I]